MEGGGVDSKVRRRLLRNLTCGSDLEDGDGDN